MASAQLEYAGKLPTSDPSNNAPPVGVLVPLLRAAGVAPPAETATLTSPTKEPRRGILHLYRDMNEALSSSSSATNEDPNLSEVDLHHDNPVVCTLVPSYMAISEFLDFVCPVDPFVSHYRMIRGKDPETYMVLMKFRSAKDADDYYWQYNDHPFSSMDPDICQIMFLKSVEVNAAYIPSYSFPFLSSVEGDIEDGATVCPVCLEVMDEHITGLLTILCQHTFHSHCLTKWGDGSCPVCRYSQKPKALPSPSPAPVAAGIIGPTTSSSSSRLLLADEYLGTASPLPTQHQHHQELLTTTANATQCLECDCTDDLWVCLICGHIGCGNDKSYHASQHYADTNHPYALEIETQRVWDYAGDGYVHRLIQNVVDGKLVELPSQHPEDQEDCSASQDKLEAMSLEYTHLLTTQLDSQRMYYNDLLDETTAQLSALTKQVKGLYNESQSIQSENDGLASRNSDTKTILSKMHDENAALDQQLDIYKERYEKNKQELVEEKKKTNQLLLDNENLQKAIGEKSGLIKELSDQLRDLTFFLEARDKVQGNVELEGGSVGTRSKSGQQHRRTKRVVKR